MEVLFTPSARAGFLAAIAAIRRNNRDAARKFHRRATSTLKRLTRFPDSGTIIAEFPDLPYREIYVEPYRFFYRVQRETVWIVAVWHGAQLPDEPGNVGG